VYSINFRSVAWKFLGYFIANIGRKYILKQTIGNESLHEIGNDNEVRVKSTLLYFYLE
jgi:hypothetical protein